MGFQGPVKVVLTICQRPRPGLRCSKSRAAADCFRYLCIPDSMKICAVPVVCHSDIISTNIQIFAVKRLADVANKLACASVSSDGTGHPTTTICTKAHMNDHLRCCQSYRV